MTTLSTLPRHRIDIPTRDPSREIVVHEPRAGGGGFYSCDFGTAPEPARPSLHHAPGTPPTCIYFDAPAAMLDHSGTPTMRLR